MNAPVKPVFAASARATLSVTVKTGIRAGRAAEEEQKRG